jgi:hypothetical protein
MLHSICYYRLTALYLVAGIALTTAHTPLTYSSTPAAQEQDSNDALSRASILSRFQLEVGEPPSSVFRIAHIAIAAWFAFLGAF